MCIDLLLSNRMYAKRSTQQGNRATGKGREGEHTAERGLVGSGVEPVGPVPVRVPVLGGNTHRRRTGEKWCGAGGAYACACTGARWEHTAEGGLVKSGVEPVGPVGGVRRATCDGPSTGTRTGTGIGRWRQVKSIQWLWRSAVSGGFEQYPALAVFLSGGFSWFPVVSGAVVTSDLH